MKKITLLILVAILLAITGFGQTVLLSPSGDGGFESGVDFTTNGWTTVNDITNTWNVGTVSTPSAGTNAAFVSNDLGVTNAYTNTAIQVSYFYRDITVPAGETKITLSFKWKNNGESGSWDRPFVYTAPTTSTPVANSTTVTGSTDITGTTNYLVLQTTYQTATYILPAGLAGTTFRLIFGWKNDGSGGLNPPASIDEISLVSEIPDPLHGIYTIDNTLPTSSPMVHDGTGNFASFTAAINYLNNDGISGAVNFHVLTNLTFTEETPAINATGTAANTITFQKFGSGANPILSPTGGAGTEAGITLNGGDYFTFDGIDITEATGSALEYGYFIKNASAIDGAQNNTIKNCKIILNRVNTFSRGIYQYVATTPTNATGSNSFNKFQNIIIENTYNGLVCTGNATYTDMATEVSNCTIGGATLNDLGNGASTLSALRLTSSQDAMVFNNTVRNATVTGSVTLYGIFMENVKGNNQVYNNKVYNITSTSTSTFSILYGIRLDVPATFQGAAYNNLIYGFSHGITTPSATIVCRPLAVNVTGTGTVALSYNTVNVSLNANASVAAAYLNSGTIVLTNNIFANYSAAGATSKRYAAYRNTATITSNYNDLYIPAGTNNFVGYYTADQVTLANWQTASSQDANSVSIDPIFVGATDLHPSNPALNNLGTPVPVTIDIDGITRNATTPDMGAYEFTPASCVAPGALTATGITFNSAQLGWTPNGTETLWNLEWGIAGFTQGTGTMVSGLTANSYNLSGLTASTSYSFYVQADCGGSTSTWAGPFNFFTGYCTPAPTSVDGSGITNVTCGTINNTTTAEAGNYGDYSAMIADVAQLTTATVNITFSTGYTYDTKIWVDWNDDLDFNDAGEEVYVGVSLAANPTTLIATFLVPGTAPLGNHRMRIGGLDVGPPTPCYTGSWGTYEDYTINVTVPPACLAPTALNASNFTSSSATLGWTAGGSETLWNIEWGNAGFTQGTGTVVNGLTTNTYNLSGLTASTSYSYYVQADCGGSTSTWTGPFSFNTPCSSINTFPWTEVFGATLPSCWSSTPSADNDQWLFGTSASYGAPSDHTTGTGYVAWVDDSETPIANPVVLSTPMFDLTALTNPELRFWYWIGNTVANSSSLQVDIFDGSIWHNNVGTYTQNGMWQEVIININTYKSANTQIRFVGTEYYTVYSYQSDITLDDVMIQEAPSCPAPTNLLVSNVTNNSVDLGWTSNGSETTWNIEWGTIGFIPGAGTMITGTATNPYSLSGLTSATQYDFYIQADCGAGDQSVWIGPFTFTTLCDNVNTFPFVESFDGVTYAPICWSNSGTGLWDRQTAGTSPTCTPHSGAAMSRFNCYNYSAGTSGILVTPALDLPSDLYQVRFWMYRDNGYATYTDLVNVYYNTTPNTTGATLLGTINRSNTLAPVEATANQWYEYAFNMPAGSTGNGRYVIFEAISDYGNNVFIDDVQVKLQPNTANDIVTFDVPSQISSTVGAGTVNILNCGLDVTALVPTISVSIGATISPASGVAQDFTNPVTYTVTAEDGITNSTWVVTVVPNALPTITLTSPSAVTICQGDSSAIVLDFTGTSPWTWIGDDGSGQVTFNVATTPYTTYVGPMANTTYSILSVTDGIGCSNTSTESVVVTVNIPAAVTITDNAGTLTSDATTGNQWYEQVAGIVPGETNQTFTPAVNGNYYVIVTDSNGCTSMSNVISIIVGINEVFNSSVISIYPNPANEKVWIELTNNNKSNLILQITSVDGKVLFENNNLATNNKLYVNLKNYAKGIYFVKAISETNTVVKKLIVE